MKDSKIIKKYNAQFQLKLIVFRHGIRLRRSVKIFHPCQKYFNVWNVIISPAVFTGQLRTTSSPFRAIKVGISASEENVLIMS